MRLFTAIVLIAIFIYVDGRYISSRNRRSLNHVSSKADCNLDTNIVQDIAKYENVTLKIIDYFTKGPYKGEAWKQLALLVDKYPRRMSGSKNLEDAIDYMIKLSLDNGLENVSTESVKVPKWERSEESAKLVKPLEKTLNILGLGNSVSTSAIDGITAQAIVVKSFDDLKALQDNETIGKIIVYDEPFVTYGQTVDYRYQGASEAAKKGAVAALVRSITPFSISTPHTGMQSYEDGVTKIPVAAITHEDADLLRRIQDRGEEIEITLNMKESLSSVMSRNMMVELKGSNISEKVVLVSGHLDSWDVGDGAMDDGAGSIISWLAPRAMKAMGLRPQRTVKAVLWTAEEIGLVGSTAYEVENRDKESELSFVMESDFGTFMPLGIIYRGSDDGECMMKEILKHFSSINATQLELASPGPDLDIFVNRGIPGGGLKNDDDKYFWFHHSEGDTLNVIDPDVLDLDAAFWTAFSYIVADMKYEIPRKNV